MAGQPGVFTRDDLARAYERLAPVYDGVYGLVLQLGRRHAMGRLGPRPGERILEVGVGTGLSALAYPAGCRVAAIDVSAPMLARARRRLAERGLSHVALCRMDAGRLAFGGATFDGVYAAYVMNVVPDPVRVAHELKRVTKPRARFVFLNHFKHNTGVLDPILGHVATRAGGANWDLDLDLFLKDSGLVALSVESVNVPRVSSVVVCRRR